MVPMLFLFQRNMEAALARRSLVRQAELDRKLRARGASARTTSVLAAMHSAHLPAAQYLNARVSEEDVGREYENGDTIEPEDVGKFWFVEGYSQVGGPDIIRPDDQ